MTEEGKHGTMLIHKMAGKSKSNLYWFLFDDLLVCCESKKEPVNKKLFDFVAQVPLAFVVKVDQGSSEKELKLKLVTEVLVMKADDANSRNAWINDILVRVMTFMKNKIMSQKVTKKEGSNYPLSSSSSGQLQ